MESIDKSVPAADSVAAQVWSYSDGDGWENVRLVTGICHFGGHAMCSDYPTKLTKCECPCHDSADG